jgi:serine/threonine protein kinase
MTLWGPFIENNTSQLLPVTLTDACTRVFTAGAKTGLGNFDERPRAFLIKEEIGQGGFGVIYSVTMNGKAYAIKCLGRKYGTPSSDVKTRLQDYCKGHVDSEAMIGFLEEIEYLQKLQGQEHIMPILPLYEETNHFFVYAMPDCAATLFLHTKPDAPTTDQETALRLLKIIWQTAKALKTIHQAGFVHRDVKPKNIFLRNDWEALVGDFGITTEEYMTMLDGRSAEPPYRAPEYPSYTSKSDVFGLGITLHNVLSKCSQIIAERFVLLQQQSVKGRPDDRPTSREFAERMATLLWDSCQALVQQLQAANQWDKAWEWLLWGHELVTADKFHERFKVSLQQLEQAGKWTEQEKWVEQGDTFLGDWGEISSYLQRLWLGKKNTPVEIHCINKTKEACAQDCKLAQVCAQWSDYPEVLVKILACRATSQFHYLVTTKTGQKMAAIWQDKAQRQAVFTGTHEDVHLLELAKRMCHMLSQLPAGLLPTRLSRDSVVMVEGKILLAPWHVEWDASASPPHDLTLAKTLALLLLEFWAGKQDWATWQPDQCPNFQTVKAGEGLADEAYVKRISDILQQGRQGTLNNMKALVQELAKLYREQQVKYWQGEYQKARSVIAQWSEIIEKCKNEDLAEEPSVEAIKKYKQERSAFESLGFADACQNLLRVLRDLPVLGMNEVGLKKTVQEVNHHLQDTGVEAVAAKDLRDGSTLHELAERALGELAKYPCNFSRQDWDADGWRKFIKNPQDSLLDLESKLREYTGDTIFLFEIESTPKHYCLLRQKNLTDFVRLHELTATSPLAPSVARQLLETILEQKEQLEQLVNIACSFPAPQSIYLDRQDTTNIYVPWLNNVANTSSKPLSEMLACALYGENISVAILQIPLQWEQTHETEPTYVPFFPPQIQKIFLQEQGNMAEWNLQFSEDLDMQPGSCWAKGFVQQAHIQQTLTVLQEMNRLDFHERQFTGRSGNPEHLAQQWKALQQAAQRLRGQIPRGLLRQKG